MSPWILVGIVLLGLMVLVHEWGHFVIAKLMGVRVEIFSIGFGKRIWGITRGPTDYRLSVLPLGGYVKMAGDNPAEGRTGAPDEFFSKPRWQRTLIVLGGPTVNILTAVLLLTGVFYVHYERPAILDEPPVVAAVLSESPAGTAGIQPGDRILKIGAGSTATWEDVGIETALASGPTVPVVVQRAGQTLTLSLTLPERGQPGLWEVGWLPDISPVVIRVSPTGPAGKAGIKSGDLLLAMNGEKISISPEGQNPISQRLQQLGGQPVVLTIEREGKQQDINVTPEYGDHPDGKRWLLGLEYGPHFRTVRKQLTLPQAFQESLHTNVSMGRRMLDLVARLFTGRASLRGVSGPVGIVHVTGAQGEQGGWLAVLNLTAAISLSLGILNLLPIPILDGGHILFFAIEGVLRRDLSLTLKERLSQVAMGFLLLVFVFVMYNDIVRIFFN
ncbi:MAG TPA: RIP metalloprotease RseP [Candidatus Xenobia bacterium]|nr:RIP metalloprotease RseP [Candidatus Xenobia bacterium]